ncbi:MAG: DNA repair protein RecO [Nitrospinota bacterium]|nr:DNA repair protein RecO [Nitrospinota bacterium]
MPRYNDEALVLRNWDYGESDRIVSVFCRNHGKVRVIAKGAKKMKSRFLGRLEPFQTVKLSYLGKEHSQLFILSSIELTGNNMNFISNLDKFSRACYLVEMVEAGLKEGDPNRTAFDTVVRTLKWIGENENGRGYEWITRFFDVRFLSSLGYRPTLDRCVTCGKKFELNSKPFFNPEGGGLSCEKCAKGVEFTIPVSLGSARFLEKILSGGFEMAARLKPSPMMIDEIEKSITAFRNSRLQRVFKTERYFNIGKAV